MSNNRKYLKFCEVCVKDIEHKIWYPYLKGGFVCGRCIKGYVKGLNESVNKCKEVMKESKLLKLKVDELQDDLDIERLECKVLKKELDSYKDC